MNSTFTTLRTLACVVIFSLSFSTAFSQAKQVSTVDNLQASVKNNKVYLSWNSDETSSYCQIQASTDGKNFSTIGLVLGADPKNNNSFSFKQDLNKMRAGQIFYRVLTIQGDDQAYASQAVKATQSL